MMYVTKNKIMIQGNFKDAWIKVDYPRLLNLVNAIEPGVSEDERISQAYAKIFNREVKFTDEFDIPLNLRLTWSIIRILIQLVLIAFLYQNRSLISTLTLNQLMEGSQIVQLFSTFYAKAKVNWEHSIKDF